MIMDCINVHHNDDKSVIYKCKDCGAFGSNTDYYCGHCGSSDIEIVPLVEEGDDE